MNPLGVGGIALGSTSLTITIFRLVTDIVAARASRLRTDDDFLLISFELESLRLSQWGEAVGINENQLHLHIPSSESRALATKILLLMGEILVDVNALNEKHGIRVTFTGPEVLQPTNNASANGLSSAGEVADDNSSPRFSDALANFIIDKPSLGEAIRKVSNGALNRNRLLWHLYDKVKYQSLLQQLRSFNDGLSHILGSRERRCLRLDHQTAAMASNEQGFLQNLEKAAELSNYSAIAALAGVKCIRLSVETEPIAGSLDLEPLVPQVDFKSLRFSPPRGADDTLSSHDFSRTKKRATKPVSSATREYATLSDEYRPDRKVLIDWRRFSNPLDEYMDPDAFIRVRGLCRLFAAGVPGLRIPNCLGYCIDEGNAGLGYVFEAKNSDLSPKSLYEHFKVASKHRPELYDRFSLAAALAESVLALHNSRWLHKGIRSHNILFFGKDSNVLVDLSEPRLVGFEWARYDGKDMRDHSKSKPDPDPELDRYRHPSCQGPVENQASFERKYDIYALGVVLLEIGAWKSVKMLEREYLERDRKAPRTEGKLSPENLRDMLRRWTTSSLSFYMGRIYSEVVRKCLEYDMAVAERDADSNALQLLREDVVKELWKCQM